MKIAFVKSLLMMLMILPAAAHALELTPQQMANLQLKTTKAVERQAATVITVNGDLRADRQRVFRIAPVVDGLVTALNVVEHAAVRKGQVLANLHSNALGQAQAEYLEARARHEVTRAEHLRIKGLYQDGVVSESRLLEAESRDKTAQAELDQRRHALSMAGLNAAQIARLNERTEQIAEYPLLSPADGVVLEVGVENGQFLAAGVTAFRIADLSVLWADIRIHVAQISQTPIGATAVIKTAAFPQQSFEGRLQSLSGEADAKSQTISGRVVIDNRAGLLRPGMYVQAELKGAARTGLMVPRSAVFRRGNDDYLFTVGGPRRFEPVKVTLGGTYEDWVSITAGITAGTEVVSGGVAELKSHWQYQGGE